MVEVSTGDTLKNAGSAQDGVVGIDMLRLLAAGSVMFFHLGFKAFSHPGSEVLELTGRAPTLPGSWPWPWTWWGWVGVQVFLVISGLVIAFPASSCRATP